MSTIGAVNGGLAGDDVWVLDLEEGSRLQLTSGNSGHDPTWIAGGDSVAYIDGSGTMSKLVVRAADGSGNPRELFVVNESMNDLDISPDGDKAVYVIGNTVTGVTRLLVRNLRTGAVVDLTGDENVDIRNPRFSPDGKYVAYEIGPFVQAKAVDGTGVPIHIGQEVLPRWSKDGTKLFGAGAEGNLYSHSVSLDPRLTLGQYVPVAYGFGRTDLYDVFEDGRSGIFNTSDFGPVSTGADIASRSDTTATVTVTVNWIETLKESDSSER